MRRRAYAKFWGGLAALKRVFKGPRTRRLLRAYLARLEDMILDLQQQQEQDQEQQQASEVGEVHIQAPSLLPG